MIEDNRLINQHIYYNSVFLQNHLSTIDQIISYLYEIRNLVIEYFDKRSTNILLCVNDTTFAGDEITRKNFDEYLFQLYDDLIN